MHICTTCDKEIVAPSPIATYENRFYHPDCLSCSSCRKSLSGKQFVKEKNGNLMCEECNEKYAPKCVKCHLSFKSGQPYKKITDEIFYHNECFKCAGPCHKPIAGEFYDLENERFLCTECYDKYGAEVVDSSNSKAVPPPPVPTSEPPHNNNRPSDRVIDNLVTNFNIKLNDEPPKSNNNTTSRPSGVETLPAVERKSRFQAPPERERNSPAPTNKQPATTPAAPSTEAAASKPKEDLICAKCNQKLTGTYTVYENKKYHTKCFVCCQCNQEFTEKSFFKLNGNPLCRNCHSKNLVDTSSRCAKCSQPILDTIVTFKNREFHDYCLTCNECNNKLVGQSIYTDKQDKPYCAECFTRREGKSCGKCKRIIAPNQSNLVFEGKNFHKECFTCQKCSRAIASTESFFRSDDADDAVICEKCIN